ncbi:hypothetical protein ACM39_12900 [Chryseobacterium sp. FH2]|uniref:hypothetical protein n=1 Tax=Chryseobacterium sp. FH2 TaxID=1674291 RepID=UPI00065AE53B|nr:hypothetical protein [Chryseobacterium sp. FH2]KMQ67730.1 hypothetical protein ACM39_12900 [Chryseobacterium sp. FH2]
MNDFIKLLSDLEKQPLLFINKKDISLLNAFITGYLLNDIFRNNKRPNYDFRSSFSEWLKEKYNFEQELSWAEYLNSLSKYESLNAVDLFFREFHIFQKETNNYYGI